MNIGDKFGRLIVTSERYKKDGKGYYYFVKCLCECGSEEKEYRSVSLTKNKNPTKSCGCLQKESASMLKTEVIGKIFSRLTVVEDLGIEDRRRWVLTECSCGTKNFKARIDQLQNDHTKSCGCLYAETRGTSSTKHGMSGTPEYRSWQSMKERCRNPNAPGYENYGGRGITYDPSWEEFENFYKDMGKRPEGMEIDRIDVNKNYNKDNCRWSDGTIQTFNKRKRKGLTSKYHGVYFNKEKEKWHTRLYYYSEIVFDKYFMNEEDAARAYDNVCFEYYGVRKNFPDEN